MRHPQRSCNLLERVIYISFILASPHSGLSTCSPSPHMHRGWMWEVYVMGSGANCAVTCWNLAHLRRKKNLFIRPAAFVLLLECEGSVYQKQYPTLSWQINSYKLTSWGRPLYRLWWKEKIKTLLLKRCAEQAWCETHESCTVKRFMHQTFPHAKSSNEAWDSHGSAVKVLLTRIEPSVILTAFVFVSACNSTCA